MTIYLKEKKKKNYHLSISNQLKNVAIINNQI